VSVINLDPIAVTITGAARPANPTTSTNAAFAFTSSDPVARTGCKLDARPFAACTTATSQLYRSLKVGRHTFIVLAIDPDGSRAAAAYVWRIEPPAITHLRQAARTWREGTKTPARRIGHLARIGTVFTFTLSETARLSVSFTARAQGRRFSGRCVAPSKRTTYKPRCTRTIVAGALTAMSHRGTNRITFKGRVKGRRTLGPGRYTLVLTAAGSGARTSPPSSISFTIVAG
jgi:hypothetical protein